MRWFLALHPVPPLAHTMARGADPKARTAEKDEGQGAPDEKGRAFGLASVLENPISRNTLQG